VHRRLQVLGIPWARVMAWAVMMCMAYYLRHFLGVRTLRAAHTCAATCTYALTNYPLRFFVLC
jgi:hypothetical protein